MSQSVAARLADALQAALTRAYDAVTPDEWEEMAVLRDRIGDSAYGGKAGSVFDRVTRETVKSLDLHFEQRFPPPFEATHETPAPDGARVRWYEGVLLDADGRRVAKLRLGYHHRHDRFAVPRAPEVIVEPTDS
jgi:Family of unknown function (DUF6022)